VPKYTKIQPTHVIDGVEMESLERDAEPLVSKFKDIRIGRPLLYSPEDYAATIEALKGSIKSDCDAVMLVGHGTYEPITASYAMMDYMLKSRGLKSWHVATVEGYPSFDDGAKMLSQSGAKSVCLVPFMFVAGVHAQEDIAGEWREKLEAQGYKVELFMEGMGQNAAIRKIYIDHIDFAMNNVSLDIMKKKMEYAK
ncbi:MAG: sirohydrochlorin cobaltochelatase, partial [Rikenellaceae bacterium]